MSLLEDLNTCLLPLGIPIETGVFSDTPPDEYLVITPLGDSFGLHGDNAPLYDIQEARLSYFNKGNYTKQKNAMIRWIFCLASSWAEAPTSRNRWPTANS